MLVLARVLALAAMFEVALSLVVGLHPPSAKASAAIPMNATNLNFIIGNLLLLPMRQSSESVRAHQNMAARAEALLGSLQVLGVLTKSRRAESGEIVSLVAYASGGPERVIFHLLILLRGQLLARIK